MTEDSHWVCPKCGARNLSQYKNCYQCYTENTDSGKKEVGIKVSENNDAEKIDAGKNNAVNNDSVKSDTEIKVPTENQYEKFIQLGDMYQKNKEYDRAFNVYQNAIPMEPRNSKAYSRLGMLLFFNGNLDNSRSKFTTALALNPNDAIAKQGMEMIRQRQSSVPSSFTYSSSSSPSSSSYGNNYGANSYGSTRNYGNYYQPSSRTTSYESKRSSTVEMKYTGYAFMLKGVWEIILAFIMWITILSMIFSDAEEFDLSYLEVVDYITLGIEVLMLLFFVASLRNIQTPKPTRIYSQIFLICYLIFIITKIIAFSIPLEVDIPIALDYTIVSLNVSGRVLSYLFLLLMIRSDYSLIDIDSLAIFVVAFILQLNELLWVFADFDIFFMAGMFLPLGLDIMVMLIPGIIYIVLAKKFLPSSLGYSSSPSRYRYY